MTEIPPKHEETKPSPHNEQEKPIKPAATKQIKQRRRYSPRAPGFFPVPVDIVIAMSLQLALVITNFFVIFTTFTYDGDDLGWIVLAEIIFTYGGFAYFVRRISHQILVYKKFFQRLNDWHDRKLEAIKNGESSCCCLWIILLKLTWWIAALLLFPIIIGWSMIQSYGWYQDRRRNAESTVDLTQLENVAGNESDAKQYWKMTDRAYSIWHLGVLSKQASMIVMFVQDFPLLVISFIIVNYLGIIVYCVSVCIKLLFWFKHMYDLGKLTFFYKPEHYLDHFGIKSISWTNEYGCNIIIADFYNEYEHEMSTLQVGDWVGVYDEKKEDWDIMIVWKNKHFKKEDNLVLIEWKKVPKEAIDEFDKGITKKIMLPPDAVHVVNRWDGNIELLRDEDYVKYHDNGGNDAEEEAGDNIEDDNVEEEQQHVGAVVVAPTETVMVNKFVNNEMQVENDAIDEKSEDVVIDVDVKDNNDEEHGNNVNNTEVVGDSNKETEVINDAEDEESGNNMNDIEDEQDRLIESPVIIQNKDETGGEYQSVPLEDNKDKDTDDV